MGISMGKRIAVFSTAWNAELIGEFLRGMSRRARETGNSLYIFNNYGGFHGEKEYNDCEYNIFELALKSNFDGAVIISNNIASRERVVKLVGQLKERNIPCISVEQEIDGVCMVGTDNYAAMSDVVEHLIEVHKCRVFNYIGGPAANMEAVQRRQAFCDTLRRHGIEPETRRMGEYSFSEPDGEKAFNDFADRGCLLADAVVCANDMMAIGFISKLEQCGYKVPEDMRVTGFDNTLRAQSNIPGLASVKRCNEELGRQCVDRMVRMMAGGIYPKNEYSTHEYMPNESCGCIPYGVTERHRKKEIFDILYTNEDIRRKINYMQTRLMTAPSLEDFAVKLWWELNNFKIDNFCLLIDESQYKENGVEPSYGIDDEAVAADAQEAPSLEYPENMLLLLNKKGTDNRPVSFVTSKLIPDGFIDEKEKSHIIVFMPLHHNGRQFGYCVMENGIEYIENGSLYYWLSVLNTALETIRQSICIRELNKKLAHLYMYDVMTGIYNRFALQHVGAILFEKNRRKGRHTLFLFADMDGLKKINDTYGHEVGDAAIKAMALILNDVKPDSSFFCLRYGGDEFLLMGSCDNEDEAANIQKQIEKKIDAYNSSGMLPAALSASIGHIISSPDEPKMVMEDYIRMADKMMYRIKQERKRERR